VPLKVRLQKLLADAGIASRRASELIITSGRVKVNGQLVMQLGTQVDPEHDHVSVDGQPVRTRRKLYLALNKPRGFVCSRHDPEKRPSLGDLLPKEWTDLYSVGRLDRDSEGLIFITNDGQFCLRLTHPRFGVRKKYRVEVEGELQLQHLSQITRGLAHEGEQLRAAKARFIERNRSRSLVEIELEEGKNREVRRLFEVLGFQVSRLQRVQIGRIKLGELPLGKWRTLTESEIKSLLPAL
jgi:23S rRNA pseudouridine2605 synthase